MLVHVWHKGRRRDKKLEMALRGSQVRHADTDRFANFPILLYCLFSIHRRFVGKEVQDLMKDLVLAS